MKNLVQLIVLMLLMSGVVVGQKLTNGEFKKLNDEMRESYSKGDYDKALALASRIVEVSEREFGKNDLGTAQALKNRAAVELAKGDEKAAEKSFDKAVDIYKQHKAELNKAQGASLADSLETLGRIRAKTDLLWTEGIFKEALEWRERSNGPDSAEVVTPLVQLANIQFWRREFKKSSEFYARALRTLGNSSGVSRDDVTLVYYRTLCSYRKAKIEEDFEPLRTAYRNAAEFNNLVPAKPKFINAGVINGKAVYLDKPRWPNEAKNANADGTVEVDVLINEEGNVISACGKPGGTHPALVEVAEVSAYKSRFSPTTLQGNPVKVSGRIVYQFRRLYRR